MSIAGPLYVGIDGGGTSIRVSVANRFGKVLASSQGHGINPNSGGNAEEELSGALGAAVSQLSPEHREHIVGGVAGLAGALTRSKELEDAADAAWQANSLSGALSVVSDLVVAFWSGIEDPTVTEGAVLIAGTGAVAALIQGSAVAAIRDGYGYLLGDRGSGVWLGQRGLQAALDGSSARGPDTALTETILKGNNSLESVSGWYTRPPRDLGELAPLVTRAAERGDPVATRICGDAARELEDTVRSLPYEAEFGEIAKQIVVAGAVAAGPNVVGKAVRASLEADGWTVRLGASGTKGALRLAARLFEVS